MKFFYFSLLRAFLLCLLFTGGVWSHAVHAITPEILKTLSTGDNSERIAAIDALVSTADVDALPILQALLDGTLHVASGGEKVVILDKDGAHDALTKQVIDPIPAGLEKITINNRVRRILDSALAALKLSFPDPRIRLAAAEQLQDQASEDFLPLIETAQKKEQDSDVRAALALAKAGIQLKSTDAALRLEAVRVLAQSSRESTKAALLALIEKDTSGNYPEPDPAVRAEIKRSLAEIDSRLSTAEYIGRVFSGISLGSVLLLAALGLAITYGLMGVINMAHGELLMIGAYTTYMVQVLFKSYWPEAFDLYLVVALPAAFIVSALVGMAMERSVIRYLYGRPLETLLATWGISLILIQTVRTIFGAQNVEVVNPAWMSGGFALVSNLVLPYNRIAIIVFSMIVLVLIWVLLNRTRLGLFVRAVTQNRTMADCAGVPTRKVDMWAFGLGSGVAGLGGCALSQIGNVGPDLGQSYIVDSFMVVVLGGVGQIAGTVFAALGLGVVNKFLEPYAGAVLAKIFILVFIIIVIQKRPQGLFALKGRTVEN